MELIKKAEAFVESGDRYMNERMLTAALTAYRNAVYAAGAVFAYEETGILMHDEELKSFLESRFPEVHAMLVKCDSLEGNAEAIRATAMELIEMAKKHVESEG